MSRLLLLLLLAGCGSNDDGSRPDPAEPPPEQHDEAPPDEIQPDPVTHPCVVMIAQFERAMDEGSASCTTAADCACYPGGIGRRSGCGGVTGAETAARLQEIAGRYLAAGCQHTQQCAAWECAPRCESGTCVR